MLVLLAADNVRVEAAATTSEIFPAKGESSSMTTSTTTHHGDTMMAWLQSDTTCHGGYAHAGVEFRRLPYKNNRTYGVFAATDFQRNETLLEIPRDCILLPRRGHVGDRVEYFGSVEDEDDEDEEILGRITAVHSSNEAGTPELYDILFDDGDVAEQVKLGELFDFEEAPLNCATVRTLANELKLGSQSKFGPYIQYLWETQQPSNELLPSGWSPAGQDLLRELVLPCNPGDEDEDAIKEVPYGLLDTLVDDWFASCQSDPTDDIGNFAATLTVMRAWDERLIPVYDTFNHRNGRWNNVDNDEYSVEHDKVRVYATRNIKAGEQLYISYNTCNDCGGRLDHYGTPEIMRDYGFVEEYPRRFFIPGVMAFELDFPTEEDSATADNLQLTWLGRQEPQLDFTRAWLREQWSRLYDLNETALAVRDPRITSDHEWQVIVQYHDALVTALGAAWRSLTGQDIASVSDADTVACLANQGGVGDASVCSLELNHYVDLMEQKVEEWTDQRPDTCEYFGTHDMQAEDYDTIEPIKSHYQQMEFLVHRTYGTPDLCFDLEDTIQICESYRPHYHEMFVHYTARFIERVERVMFVGGGDSMLLHDILKYPTLKKVVGLELDQQVVRSSFRYFGSQPHFDNDKVEWWFGDATKSLMMLPKDYFGSFDIVLVDLSETVAALSVTEELDVMQALTLLIQPNGILVKNEILYFPEMKSLFPHALHVHYYDVPYVCSQSLILGSNSISFPRAPAYDHQIETLLKLLDDPRHEVMHDYQHNVTIDNRYCAKQKRTKPTAQTASPGIIMIVEADDAESTQVLHTAKALGGALEKKLKKLGFSVALKNVLHEDKDGATLLLLMDEGYIVSRSFPEHQYCGFDIILWSKFEQMDGIKTAVAALVSSKTVSQYRIVAGGMFGLPSWQEDEQKRGPDASRIDCGSDSATSESALSPERDPGTEFMKAVLGKIMPLIGSVPADGSVAILCGLKGRPCSSLNVLKESTEFDLIPLWTCGDLTDGVEFAKDGPQKMFACQKSIYFALEEALIQSSKKINAIVIDSDVSYPMGQIVHSLLSNKRNAHRWLDEDTLSVIAPYRGKSGAWRLTLVDALRKHIIVNEPVFGTEVQVNSTANGSLNLVLLKSGDKDFIKKLDETLAGMEEGTGVQASINSLRGGALGFQHNFIPSQIFSHAEFDNRDASKQWQSQKPLGYQNIFQLEGSVKSCDSVAAALKDTVAAFKKKSDSSKTEKISLPSGDGCLVTALWSGGNAIAAWDGRQHVDVNMYLVDEDKAFAESFSKDFTSRSKLEVTLRDIQPRGSGRVVNFRHHVDSLEVPHWKSTA